MKKSLLTISFFFTCALIMAQTYHVGTDIQKRKVLLEEYTGLNCGHCPEGHLVAKTLLNSMPGQAFAVNIHTGSYAVPSSDEPDYRIDEGDSLAALFNVDSYPSGTINRTDFAGDGQYLLSRSDWVEGAGIINKKDAPVNLYVKSIYDGNTRILTVHVEGYFTADAQNADQHINVVLTQDYIKGYQNGSSEGSDYIHMHMLRAYISPLWGDAISNAKKGEYFSKDYTYTLPAAIKDVTLKPEDIRIIAFVTSGKTNVLNAEGGKPGYVNFGTEMAGEISTPDMPIGVHYGYNFFEIKLKNNSASETNTATFNVTVNDVTTEHTVNCTIDPFEQGLITVPATYEFTDKGKAKYSIQLTKMNGMDVTATALTGSFTKPIETANSVKVKFTTDCAASQNRFMLKDADGNIIKEYGPYKDGASNSVDEEITGLEEGKTYCFEITDSWGDGLFDTTNGSLITHTSANKLIDQFYRISGFGTRSFFKSTSATGITEMNTDKKHDTYIYTLDGRRVSHQTKGIYITGGKKIIER